MIDISTINQQFDRQYSMKSALDKSKTILELCKAMSTKEANDTYKMLSDYYRDISLSLSGVYYTAIDYKSTDTTVCILYDIMLRERDAQSIGQAIELVNIYNDLIYVNYMTYYTEESLEIDVSHKDLKDYGKTFVQRVIETIEKNVAIANIEEMTNLLYDMH